MSQAVIVIIVIAAYFALLMGVSYFAGRGSDNSTFFTGRRQAPWPLVAFAMLGAAISGVTFISVPGMVVGKGYAYLQMVLGFIVGYAAIAFVFNVIVTIALIWLYTVQGGVKTLIWTDTIKSFCLIMSVILCIYFVATNMGFSFGELTGAIADHPSSRMFFFDNPKEGTYFWKQFLAGVFMAIATNGLDQDMMQRNLACRDSRQSQKNMIVSGVTQFFVIALFLILGTVLVMFITSKGIAIPEKTDELFGMVAQHPDVPVIVLILFVLGLISAAYSAAGSALTSLTTSYTVDILGAHKTHDDKRLTRTRKAVHMAMSVVMGLVIIAFYYLSDQDAISAVYTLASYTYGPILGLFVYGMFWQRPVRDRLVPVVCVAAPVLSWCLQYALKQLWGYETSFELLIINALITVIGLRLLSVKY